MSLIRSLCLVCLLSPSTALAYSASDVLPFKGVWAESAAGCRLWKEGKLDEMIPRSKAARHGLTEVTLGGFQLLYSAADCKFDPAGNMKRVGQAVTLPATCSFKAQEKEARVSLVLVGNKLDLRVNGDTWGKHVRCR
jgi:hypothetical protein